MPAYRRILEKTYGECMDSRANDVITAGEPAAFHRRRGQRHEVRSSAALACAPSGACCSSSRCSHASAFTLSGVIRLAYGKSLLPHKAVATQSKARDRRVPDSAKITDVRAGSTTLAEAVVLAALAIACWILCADRAAPHRRFRHRPNRGSGFSSGRVLGA